jgi:hypothetical protein
MSAQDWVTTLALVAGVICFLLFVWDAFTTIRSKAAAPPQAAVRPGISAQGVTTDQVTKLFEAAGKMAESFGKAGPALASLVGAILFFAIAAATSGAFQDRREDRPATAAPRAALPLDGAGSPGATRKVA